MGTNASTENDEGAQDDNPTFRAGEVEVQDHGRVTIPHRLRERYGVEEDDVVDLRIHTDGVTFMSLNRIVDSKGRVTIPANERRIYDINEDDMVGVDVMVTGMAADDDEKV